MNRRKLERHLRAHECRPHHHGGGHDIWINKTGDSQVAVPRHTEINTFTTKSICRALGVPVPAAR